MAWVAAASTAIGLGQAVVGGIKAHKAQTGLENMANNYQPNQSIMDYYNKALSKYSANPYTSAAYQNRTNTIQRNLATGISATQDRHGGLASIGELVQGANDANANAASQAESQQRADLSQLGTATGMKAAEDFKPFEIKYNLLGMKASGANAEEAAGIKNAFGGLQSEADLKLADKMYSDGTTGIEKYKTTRNTGFSTR